MQQISVIFVYYLYSYLLFLLQFGYKVNNFFQKFLFILYFILSLHPNFFSYIGFDE